MKCLIIDIAGYKILRHRNYIQTKIVYNFFYNSEKKPYKLKKETKAELFDRLQLENYFSALPFVSMSLAYPFLSM